MTFIFYFVFAAIVYCLLVVTFITDKSELREYDNDNILWCHKLKFCNFFSWITMYCTCNESKLYLLYSELHM